MSNVREAIDTGQRHYVTITNQQGKQLVLEKHGIANPYILYTARLEHPGKNHVNLLEAFARLKEKSGLPHHLVLAGTPWYGADAVYLGGKDFSLRNFSGNFSLDGIEQAIAYSHDRGKKVYVAVNIYARNYEQPDIAAYLEKLGALDPDGIIVADPGIFLTAREILPDTPLHLSTQANSTNYKTVEFWERMGIRRINAARELTLAEIQAIGEQTQIEIEAFVHGAMCIAYSGRCLLSSFMAKRHSNRGMCTHPCRWKYALVEETRAGHYMPSPKTTGVLIFSTLKISA